MSSKLFLIILLGITLFNISCAKKQTDFEPQIIELKDEDLNALLTAQDQELISQSEVLSLIEEYKNGSITKEELKTKLQSKIMANGLEKKEIKFADSDIDIYFEDKENDYKEKSFVELINIFLKQAVSSEVEFEKNGLQISNLEKLRADQDEELIKTIEAINKKIENYDLSSAKGLGKMLDLIHIHKFTLINHLTRNNQILNQEIKNLADLTVSGNPLELLTHPMLKIGKNRLKLSELQEMILEAAPSDLYKLYIPFMLMTGAKGQAHLLNQAYINNQFMILGQIQLVVGTTMKYESYVKIDQEKKVIHLNELFFSLYKNQMGEGFDKFIKDQLTSIYGLPANDLNDFTIQLDIKYDYSIDRV
jgi:hypothetical protein